MESVTVPLSVNVNAKNKKEAARILKDLGLNISTAINMFLAQIIKTNGIPFMIINHKPSKELLESLSEVDEMINNPKKYPCYNNREDLKKSILSDE